MKLICLILILASVAISQDAPFACNLKVFQPEERKQHAKLTHEVMAAIANHRELPSGYAFQIDSNRVSLLELAEWVQQEKRCCPFFDFQIALEGAGEGGLTLTLTGKDGVKQFITAEFHKP
ncbi:MAG TPA: hypothetical protein VKX49_21030 [Bryobacteraceae bacterium]|nr:hypothetical protein [Bryobacteraceae bacterium]